MKSKTICFCIPSRKHKETNHGDSGSSSPQQKASHDKPRKGSKTREHAPMAPGSHANNAGPDSVTAVPAMGAGGDGSAHGGGVVGAG